MSYTQRQPHSSNFSGSYSNLHQYAQWDPNKFIADVEFMNNDIDGTGVDVFCIDTGVDPAHPDFIDKDGNSRVQMVDWSYLYHNYDRLLESGSAGWDEWVGENTSPEEIQNFIDYVYEHEMETYGCLDRLMHRDYRTSQAWYHAATEDGEKETFYHMMGDAEVQSKESIYPHVHGWNNAVNILKMLPKKALAGFCAGGAHGTHVMSTIAGNTSGWASGARIYDLNTYHQRSGRKWLYGTGNMYELLYYFMSLKAAAGINRPTILNVSMGWGMEWNDVLYAPNGVNRFNFTMTASERLSKNKWENKTRNLFDLGGALGKSIPNITPAADGDTTIQLGPNSSITIETSKDHPDIEKFRKYMYNTIAVTGSSVINMWNGWDIWTGSYTDKQDLQDQREFYEYMMKEYRWTTVPRGTKYDLFGTPAQYNTRTGNSPYITENALRNRSFRPDHYANNNPLESSDAKQVYEELCYELGLIHVRSAGNDNFAPGKLPDIISRTNEQGPSVYWPGGKSTLHAALGTHKSSISSDKSPVVHNNGIYAVTRSAIVTTNITGSIDTTFSVYINNEHVNMALDSTTNHLYFTSSDITEVYGYGDYNTLTSSYSEINNIGRYNGTVQQPNVTTLDNFGYSDDPIKLILQPMFTNCNVDISKVEPTALDSVLDTSIINVSQTIPLQMNQYTYLSTYIDIESQDLSITDILRFHCYRDINGDGELTLLPEHWWLPGYFADDTRVYLRPNILKNLISDFAEGSGEVSAEEWFTHTNDPSLINSWTNFDVAYSIYKDEEYGPEASASYVYHVRNDYDDTREDWIGNPALQYAILSAGGVDNSIRQTQSGKAGFANGGGYLIRVEGSGLNPLNIYIKLDGDVVLNNNYKINLPTLPNNSTAAVSNLFNPMILSEIPVLDAISKLIPFNDFHNIAIKDVNGNLTTIEKNTQTNQLELDWHGLQTLNPGEAYILMVDEPGDYDNALTNQTEIPINVARRVIDSSTLVFAADDTFEELSPTVGVFYPASNLTESLYYGINKTHANLISGTTNFTNSFGEEIIFVSSSEVLTGSLDMNINFLPSITDENYLIASNSLEYIGNGEYYLRIHPEKYTLDTIHYSNIINTTYNYINSIDSVLYKSCSTIAEDIELGPSMSFAGFNVIIEQGTNIIMTSSVTADYPFNHNMPWIGETSPNGEVAKHLYNNKFIFFATSSDDTTLQINESVINNLTQSYENANIFSNLPSLQFSSGSFKSKYMSLNGYGISHKNKPKAFMHELAPHLKPKLLYHYINSNSTSPATQSLWKDGIISQSNADKLFLDDYGIYTNSPILGHSNFLDVTSKIQEQYYNSIINTYSETGNISFPVINDIITDNIDFIQDKLTQASESGYTDVININELDLSWNIPIQREYDVPIFNNPVLDLDALGPDSAVLNVLGDLTVKHIWWPAIPYGDLPQIDWYNEKVILVGASMIRHEQDPVRVSTKVPYLKKQQSSSAMDLTNQKDWLPKRIRIDRNNNIDSTASVIDTSYYGISGSLGLDYQFEIGSTDITALTQILASDTNSVSFDSHFEIDWLASVLKSASNANSHFKYHDDHPDNNRFTNKSGSNVMTKERLGSLIPDGLLHYGSTNTSRVNALIDHHLLWLTSSYGIVSQSGTPEYFPRRKFNHDNTSLPQSRNIPTDASATFSTRGSAVEIWSPGWCINAACYFDKNAATDVLFGTHLYYANNRRQLGTNLTYLTTASSWTTPSGTEEPVATGWTHYSWSIDNNYFQDLETLSKTHTPDSPYNNQSYLAAGYACQYFYHYKDETNTGYVTESLVQYREMSGTSMASPNAAGILALIAQVDPSLTQEKARQALNGYAAYRGYMCDLYDARTRGLDTIYNSSELWKEINIMSDWSGKGYEIPLAEASLQKNEHELNRVNHTLFMGNDWVDDVFEKPIIDRNITVVTTDTEGNEVIQEVVNINVAPINNWVIPYGETEFPYNNGVSSINFTWNGEPWQYNETGVTQRYVADNGFGAHTSARFIRRYSYNKNSNFKTSDGIHDYDKYSEQQYGSVQNEGLTNTIGYASGPPRNPDLLEFITDPTNTELALAWIGDIDPDAQGFGIDTLPLNTYLKVGEEIVQIKSVPTYLDIERSIRPNSYLIPDWSNLDPAEPYTYYYHGLNGEANIPTNGYLDIGTNPVIANNGNQIAFYPDYLGIQQQPIIYVKYTVEREQLGTFATNTEELLEPGRINLWVQGGSPSAGGIGCQWHTCKVGYYGAISIQEATVVTPDGNDFSNQVDNYNLAPQDSLYNRALFFSNIPYLRHKQLWLNDSGHINSLTGASRNVIHYPFSNMTLNEARESIGIGTRMSRGRSSQYSNQPTIEYQGNSLFNNIALSGSITIKPEYSIIIDYDNLPDEFIDEAEVPPDPGDPEDPSGSLLPGLPGEFKTQ